MPITRLQRHTALRRKSAIARRKKARSTGQAVSLQTTHYKKFCDICFEFYIRERDRWIDTLDGRRFPQGDYEHYHAAHYIPRQALFTRYNDMNCHGQSSGHNWAASPKASPIVRHRFMNLYRAWMVKTYGEPAVAELETLGEKTGQFTIPMWMDTARETYTKAHQINARAFTKRLASVYRTGKEQGILEQIFNKIGIEPDGLTKD